MHSNRRRLIAYAMARQNRNFNIWYDLRSLQRMMGNLRQKQAIINITQTLVLFRHYQNGNISANTGSICISKSSIFIDMVT